MSKAPLITFCVPCYNVAAYMDRCIESILEGANNHLDQIEIIIVDDGSTRDETPVKADRWHRRFPKVIRVIHQANAGHGGAVNTGLAAAKGVYFKVVDADDWLKPKSLKKVLRVLPRLARKETDLLLCNYVYEYDDSHRPSRSTSYRRSVPSGKIITWDLVRRISRTKYILMHSIIVRTELLRDKIKLQLPKHSFYVDNILVYETLPAAKTLYYLDTNLYRYTIGRAGQSVDEQTMIDRIDQQIKITKIIIDSYHYSTDEHHAQPTRALRDYLAIMIVICSVFSYLANRPELAREIWQYLREREPVGYRLVRRSIIGRYSRFPRWLLVAIYRIAMAVWRAN